MSKAYIPNCLHSLVWGRGFYPQSHLLPHERSKKCIHFRLLSTISSERVTKISFSVAQTYSKCMYVILYDDCFLDINECVMQGICNNGQCVNAQGGFQCECKQGYALDDAGKDCLGRQ